MHVITQESWAFKKPWRLIERFALIKINILILYFDENGFDLKSISG